MAETLHPRNRHRGGLDFRLLTAASPALAAFVSTNAWGNETIDFADPAAVKALNTALLKQFYGVAHWDLPAGCLCPSVPGRADYVHCAANLLASSNGGVVPRGARVRALDIGVGANCVYPLIGHAEYGWHFVGADVDPVAIASAARIVGANEGLRGAIELRLQPSPARCLSGLLKPGEVFDVTLCNPPFHASAQAAEEGSRRKWKNLGKGGPPQQRPALNFGGRGRELWCPGGESSFVRRLVEESAQLARRCCWFTSLVSKSANLPAVHGALKKVRAVETRTVEMKQGQKTSRLVAWTFLDAREREQWGAARWGAGTRCRACR